MFHLVANLLHLQATNPKCFTALKSRPTLKFYLRTPEREQSTIYLRIIYNRLKAEFATGERVAVANWNKEHERAVQGKALNNRLATIETDLQSLFDKFYHQERPVSAQLLKEVYLGMAPVEQTMVDYFQRHVDYLDSLPEREFAATTVMKYRSSLKHLVNFLASKKLTEVPLSKVDYRFITQLDHFLITSRNYRTGGALERNTVNKIHRQLKAVLHKAIKEDLLEKSPYRNFPLRDAPTKRDFLTDEELNRLKEHDLGENRSLQRVRDIYLFSVYTGLRFSDATNLRMTDIVREADGTCWIEVIQGKTDEPLRIPMLRPALEIVSKYDDEERNITGRVLPRISHQKVNAYLKTIASLIGISKHLTHHTARHSFATTITLSNGVPVEAVGKYLGHTSVRTTQIYAKISNTYLKEISAKLDEKLSSKS